MNVTRLELRDLFPTKKGERLREKGHARGLTALTQIELAEIYLAQGNEVSATQLLELFADPILQEALAGEGEFKFSSDPSFVIEVFYRPGVTDNSGQAASEALLASGIEAKVAKGELYFLWGESLGEGELEDFASSVLMNPLIQDAKIYAYEFWRLEHWSHLYFPEVLIDHAGDFEEISLARSDSELLKLSTERCLALTLEELHFVQKSYRDPAWREKRTQRGLPEAPTDVELEVIAQSWSEHCKHKIFAAAVDYEEGELPPGMKKLGKMKIDSLFKSKIRKATVEVEEKFDIKWLVSVFSDNAGIVRFDPQLDLCIKVETHNSPSALDPYGGALTGILGVNRDILGAGYGARPLANMDIFCFADPNYPLKGEEDYMPAGLLGPAQLLEGVHQGVEDGGNKSGVPTLNGAIHFDQDYAGKPLVFVGTVGALPPKLKSGTPSSEKNARAGDLIFMVGGAIGADGIHGATFSSLELNENSPSTAVQIGDPLTQKRVMDFLLEARELELFSCVTDNGAGGLSSSVGEMATLTGGAKIDLALAPLKYPGLAPWELMISESQERMTFAVPKNCAPAFLELAQRRGVVATSLGEYTDSGDLEVYFNEKLVALLDLHWLHESLPQLKLKARYEGPRERLSWRPLSERRQSEDLESALEVLLSTPNIASKEGLVRRYDHEVGAASALKPFHGSHGHGPSDSGVLWLGALGGCDSSGLAISNGLAPRYSLIDPYLMAIRSADECVRGMVASGADISRMCLLDNFCWPDPVESETNPQGALKMGELVRTCEGIYDLCLAYGLPLVSGKDSMKNDFRGKNKKGEEIQISILPTLLVTGMAHLPMEQLTTSSFRASGDAIYLLGGTKNDALSLIGSEYETLFTHSEELLFHYPDLEALRVRYQKIFKAMSEGLFHSCHDVSEGGLGVALFEAMLGHELGASLASELPKTAEFWFGEGVGSFVVSVPAPKRALFESIFKDDYTYLGEVTSDFKIRGALTSDGLRLKKSFLSRWPA